MAKRQKSLTPPQSTDVKLSVPKAIATLMQAFHVSSKEGAQILIQESFKAIFGSDSLGLKQSMSKAEMEGIISLMKSLNPQDSLETLYSAQIVVCHILGMKKLSENYTDDQRLGLNLLKFCQDAMCQLDKKRRGGVQNITVNYNYNGTGQALMQAVIPVTKECLCQHQE